MRRGWRLTASVLVPCALVVSAAAAGNALTGTPQRETGRETAGETQRQPSELVDGAGRPVAWWQWLETNGPVALLVWASWAPRAEITLGGFGPLQEACRQVGLELVVLDVQEPIQSGRTILDPAGVRWIHDRHGWLLKQHRVVRIPALLILDPKGRALDTIEPTPEAVQGWRAPR